MITHSLNSTLQHPSALLSSPLPFSSLLSATDVLLPSHSPPRRPQQAATTPSGHAATVTAAATTVAAAAGGVESAGAPPRPSALLPPKASPYKDKSHQNASKAAAVGIDHQQPGSRPSTTPGDRLSGQLARLGAGGASSRREGRVGSGSGARGVAVGVAARRETFQGSSPFSTADAGAAGAASAKSVLRRVSSAMLASEGVVSSGEGDKR